MTSEMISIDYYGTFQINVWEKLSSAKIKLTELWYGGTFSMPTSIPIRPGVKPASSAYGAQLHFQHCPPTMQCLLGQSITSRTP